MENSLEAYLVSSCWRSCLNAAQDQELLGIHCVSLGGNRGVYVDAQKLQGFVAEVCKRNIELTSILTITFGVNLLDRIGAQRRRISWRQ